MIKEKEPIFALATPQGKSAIGLFRISGKNSHKIIKKISSQKKWKPNESKLNFIIDEKISDNELNMKIINTYK